jgi:DNA-binding transcriptional regulator YbjK
LNTVKRTQRPRDPQARRDALAAAVVDSIAEVGIGRTTHRSVAMRADLPLGATTYYFPTLGDLIEAGLSQATDALEPQLHVWEQRLRDAADPAEELARLVAEQVGDRRRAQLAYELYAAAMREVRLRSLARRRLDGLRAVLATRFGPYEYAVGAFVDGMVLRALTSGEPLDQVALADGVRRLTAS